MIHVMTILFVVDGGKYYWTQLLKPDPYNYVNIYILMNLVSVYEINQCYDDEILHFYYQIFYSDIF